MATQIAQLADAVSRLDTQYGKLSFQPVSNVRNDSAIFTFGSIKTFQMPNSESVIKSVDCKSLEC